MLTWRTVDGESGAACFTRVNGKVFSVDRITVKSHGVLPLLEAK